MPPAAPRVPELQAPPQARPTIPVASRTRSKHIPTAPGLGEAIALRTRSQTIAEAEAEARDAKAKVNLVMLANAAQATRTNSAINAFIAAAVPDHETGESLEYRQLIKHPKYKEVWSSSYAKELGRLCQGYKGPDAAKPPVDGTDTFHVIDFADIPPDRLKEVCYSNIVCNI
jgi:hypothetical protein